MPAWVMLGGSVRRTWARRKKTPEGFRRLKWDCKGIRFLRRENDGRLRAGRPLAGFAFSALLFLKLAEKPRGGLPHFSFVLPLAGDLGLQLKRQ
jgi:hypothetical protein